MQNFSMSVFRANGLVRQIGKIFSESYAFSEPVGVDELARVQSRASSSFWPTLLVVWMLVKVCFDDGAIKSESKAGGRQGGEKVESGRWLSHSPW